MSLSFIILLFTDDTNVFVPFFGLKTFTFILQFYQIKLTQKYNLRHWSNKLLKEREKKWRYWCSQENLNGDCIEACSKPPDFIPFSEVDMNFVKNLKSKKKKNLKEIWKKSELYLIN